MEAMPLARLQEVFPAWHISRNIPGDTPEPGFTAVERATGRRITTSTLAEMGARLAAEGENGSY
jgi:hypothetical protein